MPAKKTTKKTIVKKTAVKSAPVMEHEHKCPCGEGCHCHGRAHWVKHIVVWAIIFALGMVCGKMFCCGGHHGMKHMPKMNPVFENGCLKMDSIDCPMMREKIKAADVNGDECISLEEYKAAKSEMKKEMRGSKGMRGPKPHAPEVDD